MNARQANRIVAHWVASLLSGDDIHDVRLSEDDNLRIHEAANRLSEEMARRARAGTHLKAHLHDIVDEVAPDGVRRPHVRERCQ